MSHESDQKPQFSSNVEAVMRLVNDHGDDLISYDSKDGVREGTVRQAFEDCAELSRIAEQSEPLINAIILGAIKQTLDKREQGRS